jgi:UDP-N-acetylmuramate dehydrogenase
MRNANLKMQIAKFQKSDHFAFFNLHFALCNEARMTEESLVQKLKIISGLKVKVHEPLARYTSIKVGGPADYLLEVESHQALIQTLGVLRSQKIPFYLLGNGSNLLVSDLGVRGAVIRLGPDFKRIEWQESGENILVDVGAAYPVPQLVRQAARRGCSGLEFAEGIPGSVGGALVMNAGAYGSEMEKIVDRVEAVTDVGEPCSFSREEMIFSYRDSHLPSGIIVTRLKLHLSKGKVEEIDLRVRELVQRRKKSQPSGHPNSGSMFRNPPGDFAGRLIEAAGLKGKRMGHAAISDRHANFIVNLGGAKAEEVRGLMEMAQVEVKTKFRVELQPEVRFLGEWPRRKA